MMKKRAIDVVSIDSPRLLEARGLFARGEFESALRVFDEAVRKEPRNIKALVDAARAHGFRYDYVKAEELTERVLRMAPGRHEVQHLAGETYRMLMIGDKAIACFQAALRLADRHPPAQFELAVLYERSHRLDEALALIDDVLRAVPQWLSARLVKARILRRRKDVSGAETILRDVVAHPKASPELAAEAWADLAQLLDEQHRYDDAWSATGQSKAILAARSSNERRAADHVFGRFAQMVDQIRPADFQRWPVDADHHRARVALLTGFPRSGTTLLEQILDSHPDIVSSEERDVLSAEVFPALGTGWRHDSRVLDVLHGLSPEKINEQRSRYLRYMASMLRQPIGDRLHVDKNPATNLMIPVLLRLFPEARLIIALRDPRDVLVSCYMRYLPLNPVSVWFLSIDKAAERYALDMRAWLKFRPMIVAPFVEVRYEDTVADLESVARRTVEAMGVPWNDAVLGYRQHLEKKRVLSPTYEAVTKPLYKSAIARWRNYEKHLRPIQKAVEPFVREFGYEPT